MLPRRFEYNEYFISRNKMTVGILTLFGLFLVGIFFYNLLSSLRGIQTPLRDYTDLLLVLGTLIVVTISNLCHEPSFIIQQDGIMVNVFFEKQVFIPWNQITEIKHSKVIRYSHATVFAKKITPLHNITGLLFGGSYEPAFVITSNLIDKDEAIELINSYITKKVDPDQQLFT